MLATSSLLHSSNQFSLESMTASLVRSPNSMMEIADVTADSLLTKRGRIVTLVRKVRQVNVVVIQTSEIRSLDA
jgi:hypothetical protein